MAGNGESLELGVMQRNVVPSAAYFVLDVDETTRFRDEAAASDPPATHFHLLLVWPIIYYLSTCNIYWYLNDCSDCRFTWTHLNAFTSTH